MNEKDKIVLIQWLESARWWPMLPYAAVEIERDELRARLEARERECSLLVAAFVQWLQGGGQPMTSEIRKLSDETLGMFKFSPAWIEWLEIGDRLAAAQEEKE